MNISSWLTWKTFSICLLIYFLIPFIISIIANYITLLRTKQRVELTCKLDGWITVGELRNADMLGLELTYNGSTIRNISKLSLRIANTGDVGIDKGKFEKAPTIIYPTIRTYKTVSIDDQEEIDRRTHPLLDIVKAQVYSPTVKVDREPLIDHESGTITVQNLGVFNAGEHFIVDIYIADTSKREEEKIGVIRKSFPEIEEDLSKESFDSFLDEYGPISLNNWSFDAKAVNLRIKQILPNAFPEIHEIIPPVHTMAVGGDKVIVIRIAWLKPYFVGLAVIVIGGLMILLSNPISNYLKRMR